MKNLGSVAITCPTETEIVMTRVFEAKRADVFDAWTKAEHVSRWWDPSGQQLLVCDIDLRPGGTFRWVNRAGGEEQSFAGKYIEIMAPERLVFTVRVIPSRTGPIATLIFREVEGKTTLTTTIECDSLEDRNSLLQMGIDEGTAATLNNLAEYLNSDYLVVPEPGTTLE